MKNNEAILAALDALTIAVNANTREHNETLEQRYGPKPVGLVPPPYIKRTLTGRLLCEQYLYTRSLAHGAVAHRCILPYSHASALHETGVFGTTINWYST